jgi:hypothetical protein
MRNDFSEGMELAGDTQNSLEIFSLLLPRATEQQCEQVVQRLKEFPIAFDLCELAAQLISIVVLVPPCQQA